MNELSNNRINHIAYITNGGHTWMNAKLFLYETFLRVWKEFKEWPLMKKFDDRKILNYLHM